MTLFQTKEVIKEIRSQPLPFGIALLSAEGSICPVGCCVKIFHKSTDTGIANKRRGTL